MVNYMPLPSQQAFTKPIVCDGVCSFVEIPAALFVPGANRWDQTLNSDEYNGMMRLFMFWLSALHRIAANVVLETVMKTTGDVFSYRLWFAGGEREATLLTRQIAIHIAEANCSYKKAKKNMDAVRTKGDLLALLRLYYNYTQRDTNDISFAYEGRYDKTTVIGYFDAETQMSNAEYAARGAGVVPSQMRIDAYLGTNECDEPIFKPEPTEEIRYFRLGLGGFLEDGPDELFNYCLPFMVPSPAMVLAKTVHAKSAVGIVGKGGDFYGEIPLSVVAPRVTDISRVYHVLSALHQRYSIRAKTRELFTSIAEDSRRLLECQSVDGLPTAYNGLFHESRGLAELLEGTEPWARKAKDIVTKKPPDWGYTPLGMNIVRLMLIARENLLLTHTQQVLFCVMYIRAFYTTTNVSTVSSNIIISGDSDRGKSHAIDTAVACIPECLIATRGTKHGIIQDMRVCVVDERRGGKKVNDDLRAECTRMSTGIMHDGQGKRIERGIDFTTCNKPHDIPAPILTRSVCLKVFDKPIDVTDRELRTAGVCSALTVNASNDTLAANVALKYLCSKQYAYTLTEAMGGLPPPEMTCLILFLCLLQKSSDVDARRAGELMRMAQSVKVYDDIMAWYNGGEGEKYKFDTARERWFYARRNYLTMEHVCVAYGLIDTTETQELHILDMVRSLKKVLLQLNDVNIVVEKYYATRFRSEHDVIRYLSRCHAPFADMCPLYWKTLCSRSSYGESYVQNVEHNGFDYVGIHMDLIHSVNTPTEENIIHALWTLIETKSPLVYTRDNGQYVFVLSVRSALTTPTSANRIYPLQNDTDYEIERARESLSARQRRDGTPLFDLTVNDTVVDTPVTPNHPGAIQTSAGKWVVERVVSLPLIVHADLFKPTIATNPTKELMRKALRITGGYTKRVFLGADPSHQPVDVRDLCELVEAEEVHEEVPNIMYREPGTKDMIYSENELFNSPYFPSDKPTIVVDSSWNLEQQIAASIESQVTW